MHAMKAKLQHTSFRLDPETLRIIRTEAEKLGINQVDVIRIAVRKLAKEKR